MLNIASFSHVVDIASKLKEFFNFMNKNCEGIQRIHQLTRNEIEQYLNYINLKGLKVPDLAESKRGENITSIECIAADGWQMDPWFIFKGEFL